MISDINELYYNPDPSVEEVWFMFCKKRVEESLKNNHLESAIKVVYEWAALISENLHLRDEKNWKFFKRNIVRKYFGCNYINKKFKKGWKVTEILELLNGCEDIDFRISLFPNDIACHSKSIALPKKEANDWCNILEEIDNSCDVEVFQQASNESSLCFRRFSTLFGESVKYEVGFGQAMYVFEEEQGKHPVLSASKTDNGFKFFSERDCPDILYEKLNDLIYSYDYYLHVKNKSICTKLGIDWISIEGYFSESGLIVVDIDLPLDYVFML